MIQEWEDTIKGLEGKVEVDREILFSKLHDILRSYGEEISRDFREKSPSGVANAGLEAGYVLCLLGDVERATAMFDKSLGLYAKNLDGYCGDMQKKLKFVIEALTEFELDSASYQKRLTELQNKKKEDEVDLRTQIIHIEADMECNVGDLDDIYANGRRRQAELFEKLGERELAIKYFAIANTFEKGNRKEDYIQNQLSIVDCYLDMDQIETARSTFMSLVNSLVPEIKPGEELPDEFTDNFDKIHPFFEKLGLLDHLDKAAEYAYARLEEIDPKKKSSRELRSIRKLTILYHEGREEYEKIIDIIARTDELGKDIEYFGTVGKRKQAQYHIKLDQFAEAERLIEEDQKKEPTFRSGDEPYDWANLYLQMGMVDKAIDIIGNDSEHHKRCLVSGSYSHVFEGRRAQIEIIRAVLGKGYYHGFRNYAQDKNGIHIENNVKLLK